ncbi:EthD domain-containing protein [Parafrankia sp. BMG5.11]|uniref:EthD domain-containing protein n=2 Tax=unclassified Parafrankia TaxID=2994368 RepID=UPI000DA5377D|nr:EthD domain-containing protein [Parafrankia sp. BMG5.11]CAI7979731.1 Ethyl tert-butyl ether degradation EthD [Frankia sp. Hr75.2]SQD99471.1 Ethyl tert-butyl ether degradation EthD [Parafrankia sp. Ea1.12]
MIKIVSLMSRRPGLTMDEFIAYYEEKHVPLVSRLLPFYSDYRRNFAVEGTEHRTGHMAPGRATERLFDVMTELTYESEEMYRKTVDALAGEEIGRIIAEDEARFLDRSSIRTYIVNERR